MNIIKLTEEEIVALLDKDDKTIKDYISSIAHTADINEFFRQVDIATWPRLLSLIDSDEERAAVVSGFDRDEWIQLLPLLAPKEIAAVVKALPTDDATDLLADLALPERIEALRALNPQERNKVQELLRYPEDSAGGIMQVEVALVNESATIQDAVDVVKNLVEDEVEPLSVWVIDNNKRLIGVLALIDLLLNKSTSKISNIMSKDPVFVKPLLDQEEVAAIFKKYDLLSLPVVDDNLRVLGSIAVDDVVDVLTEEAEEDALHMAGTSAEELLHQTEVLATAKVRLPWLGVALCCSLVSGFLLHIFEPTVEKAVIILSFIPVITAMGGNVGTQSAALLIRGFATGKFDLKNVPTFLFKEIRVSLLMGLVYGLAAAFTATFVLTKFNFYLGIVVFFAMLFGMVAAAVLGVIAPSALKRLNIDPAIASGPFVTTLNDIMGIVIYMLIATAFLSKIQTG